VDDQAAIAVFDDLATQRYRRVNRSTDRSGNIAKPLIPVDVADRTPPIHYTVEISFQDLSTSAPPYPQTVVIEDPAYPLVSRSQMEKQDLRRGVTYTDPLLTGQFKRFTDFTEGSIAGGPPDSDITYDADIWSDIQASLPVTLVLYCLSYGLYRPDNRELYSQPVKLGEISIVFPANQQP
jgi:hypothetical protein